ncbi:MAG: electron transport complex subunit RsxC, partial [bacterium]
GVNVLSIIIEGQEVLSPKSGVDTGHRTSDLGQRTLDNVAPDEIRSAVKEAGIVGLGGAAFPTHVKLTPPAGKNIDTILINGCECEPYITADHRVMLEKAREVVLGSKLVAKACGANRVIFGVESNKKDAIKVLRDEIRRNPEDGLYDGIEVIELETKYPQGGEKVLIKATLDREVPSGGLPLDVGVVVANVGTCVAISEAVFIGQPLIKRVVTVTGSGIKEPKNLLVRIGTSFKDIIDQCGGLTADAYQVIMGGPMMGVAQASLDVPIVKATSCILVLNKKEVSQEKIYPCIKCGNCIDNCPMNLVPTKLAAYAEYDKYSEFEEWGGQDCMECGSCVYVCPAKIPIVQWIKLAKLKLRQMKE